MGSVWKAAIRAYGGWGVNLEGRIEVAAAWSDQGEAQKIDWKIAAEFASCATFAEQVGRWSVSEHFILAAIQAAPIYLDRQASVEKAICLIAEAGRKGASLAAFGETWIPGYAFFAFAESSAARWDAAQLYLDQAMTIPGPETDALCDAAKSADVDVVIGVVELESRTRGTVYCTNLVIGREGRILGCHRKLKPTMEERIAWGEGRGDDLTVWERSYARISTLACWEHQMVLPGYALMAQGTQVHVANWPGGEPATVPASPEALWSRQELLSRAFASQGACYVISVGGIITPDLVPEQFRSLAYSSGAGSLIIDPRGEIVARAPRGEETILTFEADPSVIRAAKTACDSAGHYSRPDIFDLRVHGVPVTSLVPVRGEGRCNTKDR